MVLTTGLNAQLPNNSLNPFLIREVVLTMLVIVVHPLLGLNPFLIREVVLTAKYLTLEELESSVLIPS